MTRTRSTFLASAALLAALVLDACGRGGAPTAPPAAPTPPPVVVKTAPVARGDIQQVLSYTGDIKAGSEIQVMPKVSGRVEKLNVDVGSHVNAGDVIAELDKAGLQAALDQAKASLVANQAKLAGMNDARLRQTQAQNGQGGPGVRQQDIDNAQHNVDAAWLAWQNLLNSPTAEQVAVAQAAVKTAQDQQKVSQKQYDVAKKCSAPS